MLERRKQSSLLLKKLLIKFDDGTNQIRLTTGSDRSLPSIRGVRRSYTDMETYVLIPLGA